MEIVKFTVEWTGNELTINGVRDRGAIIEEKVFWKNLHPQQQWEVICAANKLVSRLRAAHHKGRVVRGEISEGDADRLLKGATGGVPGKLPPI